MPESGTDGHVTLLVATALAERARAGPAVAVAEDELRRLVRRLAREHRVWWRKDASAVGAESALVATALERLEALHLIRLQDGWVRPLPALARYAVDEPTLLGASEA
jgi:uncharacterized protein (TIGR02678 family)